MINDRCLWRWLVIRHSDATTAVRAFTQDKQTSDIHYLEKSRVKTVSISTPIRSLQLQPQVHSHSAPPDLPSSARKTTRPSARHVSTWGAPRCVGAEDGLVTNGRVSVGPVIEQHVRDASWVPLRLIRTTKLALLAVDEISPSETP